MEKQKKWHLYLILAVIILTIYNILPTIFYYSNPLKKPIGQKEAEKVALDVIHRVNNLEDFTVSWLKAQSKNLGLKPLQITIDPENPRIANVTFQKPKDAQIFASSLTRAGSLIPFVPAQLTPAPKSFEEGATTVVVQRHIGVHLDPKEWDKYFAFVPKSKIHELSSEYRLLVGDRAIELALAFGGTSEPAKLLQSLSQTRGSISDEDVLRLARQIVEMENTFGDQSEITKRYFASFTQSQAIQNRKEVIHQFIARLETASKDISNRLSALKEQQKKLQDEGKFLPTHEQQRLEILENHKNVLDSASLIVRRNSALFEKGVNPISRQEILDILNNPSTLKDNVQIIPLGAKSPFIKSLEIDWAKDVIQITLHNDVEKIREETPKTESDAIRQEKLNQFLYNEIARASRHSNETITPSFSHFTVSLNKLTNSTSLLTLDIGKLAEMQAKTLTNFLKKSWQKEKGELSAKDYPVYDYATFKKLPANEQKLGLVVYAPATEEKPIEGFKTSSIYVIAKGLNSIRQKYQDLPDTSEKKAFEKDFQALQELFRQSGFIGYSAQHAELPGQFHNDYIFELDDYSNYLLAATREDFSVKGSKKYAVLEFTDVEQRILAQNKIQTRMHEDLVKWRDEYRAAKVNIDPRTHFDVPPPTQNVLWDNLKLSAAKYFRGDERKVLKWGLDLSGGKTVRIGLKDQNNETIVNEDDLRQAVNELYQRVNKLGVSEVGIRIEGSTVVLDFPGSQGFSASELIQASAMYFHIVNEKFTPNNPDLGEAVNTFLEEVWNEAVITNRTTPENINEIAWQHLGGVAENPEEFHPLSSHARLLYEHGLRLANPKSTPRSSAFNDTLSSVGIFRGSDYSDWMGQTNPLIFVFHNYALEGSNLTDVQTGYDPSEGNILNFRVKSSFVNREGQKVNPRDEFYMWTSQFSEEKIAGTPKESFSRGRGWRMAVILNGTVISAPTLNAALRDSARITGHFSQREINQLAADLKAGSLSFTPHILSEENVSPDLGKEQRTQGIMAALLGLILVIGVMCAYYRFSGLVASVAVLFNLLIIWGVLQNLGAALTLPGIAGIILAVGMSVDANVLVLERIREEFEVSRRLPSAIQAGYRKAFSAIVDSNLTTIIAALILLNFDSGPIKGFALTLIIGIISSMFTALFMTRFFFAGWVQNPAHKELKMAKLFGGTKIDFLSKAKTAMIISAIVIVVGCFFLVKERKTIFGMDFTGGYALSLDLQEKPNTDYRLTAQKALENGGASPSDFQIKELNKPNQLRIQLAMSMEQPGKPFYQIDLKKVENPLFTYQEYPRIVWILDALEKEGLKPTPHSLPDLNLHWTEMSGQLSETMRNQALMGLGLALLCILIYITIRFEFKYAISATIGLAHDILITLGLLALFHLFFEGVLIDLQVIAALVTIIGYSLNDTIIIFDRIREDMRIMRKQSFSEIVNHALNATLSRTIMTSGTTLLVLLALVFFGGPSIFNFSLIMTFGVAIGTLSSLFVAAPLLLYFHKREAAKEGEDISSPKKA